MTQNLVSALSQDDHQPAIKFQVELITPPNEDPAHYFPNSSQITQYQKSDLIFLNGAGLESFEKKVALPKSKILYTAKSFQKEWLSDQKNKEHQHGKEGKHSHGTWDPHTWVDPILAIKQLESIYLKLQSKLTVPKDQGKLAMAFQSLSNHFQQIHQKWLSSLAPKLSSRFMLCSSHPAYAYLSHRYDLKIQAFDFDPTISIDQQNGFKELLTLSQKAKQQGKKVLMLWESEPIIDIQHQLAEQGIESFTLRTIESKPKEESYLKAVLTDLDALENLK